MKTFFSSLLLLVSTFTFSQNYSIQVTESNESIGGGSNNALVVTIYEADIETVEKEWKSRVKDFSTEKTTLNKHTLFGDNAVIKEMGNNTVDIYTNFSDKKEDKTVRMVVAFDLGGAYLSSSQHKDKFEVAKKIIRDFAVKLTKEAVEAQMKEVNRAMEKLVDKQEDLEKNKKNMEERIADDKEKIKKAEEDIKKNEESIKLNQKEQEEQKKLIEAQKKVVEDTKKRLDSVK